MKRAIFALLLVACASSSGTTRKSAVEHGEDLFQSSTTSESSQNKFACRTCHRTGDDARLLPGATLAGATARPSFWGGNVIELLRAINACRYYFMGSSKDWTADDEEAKAIYAYLDSLPKTTPTAVPMTLVPIAKDLPPGDAARGADVYALSCKSCHGDIHSGQGRLKTSIPVLPDESVRSFQSFGFDKVQVRTTFVEKVRHGSFLGLFGNMPLYSIEAMSDADLSALLSYLQLF